MAKPIQAGWLVSGESWKRRSLFYSEESECVCGGWGWGFLLSQQLPATARGSVVVFHSVLPALSDANLTARAKTHLKTFLKVIVLQPACLIHRGRFVIVFQL